MKAEKWFSWKLKELKETRDFWQEMLLLSLEERMVVMTDKCKHNFQYSHSYPVYSPIKPDIPKNGIIPSSTFYASVIDVHHCVYCKKVKAEK